MKDPYGYKKHFIGGMLIQFIVAVIFFLYYRYFNFDVFMGIVIVGAGAVFLLQFVIKEWIIDKIIRKCKPSIKDNFATLYGMLIADLSTLNCRIHQIKD